MSTDLLRSPLQEVEREDGKKLKFIRISVGLIEIVELKDINLPLFWHNIIEEKALLAAHPEEPSHHYVAKDNLPMMVEA